MNSLPQPLQEESRGHSIYPSNKCWISLVISIIEGRSSQFFPTFFFPVRIFQISLKLNYWCTIILPESWIKMNIWSQREQSWHFWCWIFSWPSDSARLLSCSWYYWTIHLWKDVTGLLTEPIASRMVSFWVSPESSGIYSVSSWKPLRMKIVLSLLVNCSPAWLATWENISPFTPLKIYFIQFHCYLVTSSFSELFTFRALLMGSHLSFPEWTKDWFPTAQDL